MSTNSNKKAKKTIAAANVNVKDEITLVKRYMLQCPDVPSNSIAIQTCIVALDKELKKIDRDEKLRMKFAKENEEADNYKLKQEQEQQQQQQQMIQDDDDVVCVEMSLSMEEKITNENSTQDVDRTVPVGGVNDEDTRLDEWQDVTVGTINTCTTTTNKPNGNGIDTTGTGTMQGFNKNETMESNDNEDIDMPSLLGVALAQKAISDMSSANILISTPIAAISLALHACLRSDILMFKCTGVPDNEVFASVSTSDKNNNNSNSNNAKKKNGGFAAPVRELPKGKFLPDKWDKLASHQLENQVILRYRKDGTGAKILFVEQIMEENDVYVRIRFGSPNGEPVTMIVPLHRHVNVDALNAALVKNSKVKPALYYIDLPILLSDFSKTIDMGSVKEDSTVFDNMMGNEIGNMNPTTAPTTAGYLPKTASSSTGTDYPYNDIPYRNPTTIEDELLGRNDVNKSIIPTGDFSDDILPCGFPAPGFANPRIGHEGTITGNLMGPNHEFFQRNFGDDNVIDNDERDFNFPTPGGLGMQPRFDPYYPQGVFNGRGRGGRGRGRGLGRGGSRNYRGDPNPDHMKPPNTFGNDNMFM